MPCHRNLALICINSLWYNRFVVHHLAQRCRTCVHCYVRTYCRLTQFVQVPEVGDLFLFYRWGNLGSGDQVICPRYFTCDDLFCLTWILPFYLFLLKYKYGKGISKLHVNWVLDYLSFCNIFVTVPLVFANNQELIVLFKNILSHLICYMAFSKGNFFFFG